MTVYKGLVKVSTLEGKPTYLDITKEVEDIVRESGVKETRKPPSACLTETTLSTPGACHRSHLHGRRGPMRLDFLSHVQPGP